VFGWGRKKQEEAVEPRVLDLGEVESEIDRVLGQEAGRLVDRTRSLRDAVEAHMSEMVRVAAQMESEPLGGDVDAKVATVVRRGKKQVLDSIRKQAGHGVPPVSSVDEARAFGKASSHALAHVGDMLGKQTRVIHVFAKKHAARLKEILESYSEDAKSASELLKRYEASESEHARASELLRQIRSGQSGAKEARARAEAASAGAVKLDAEAAAKEKAASGFMETDTYRRYAAVLSEMESLEGKRKSTERSIGAVTAPISKAVSKYRYGSSLDKDQLSLAGAMLESPLEAFVQENRADIAQILSNTKKAVENGHMSVKDPSKTASCLDEAASRLDEMISQVLKYSGEKRRLESELEEADIGEMKRDEAAAAKARADAELARTRAAEALAEAEALEARRPGLVSELSSAASRLCGSACRVRLTQ